MKTSVRRVLLVLILCVIAFQGIAQNYIGLHKIEIQQKAPKAYPGFVFEKEVENGKKSFIKYVNSFDEQTLLFILDEKGYCTSISRMYNTWLFSQVKNELNKKYTKKDSLIWLEYSNNKVYEITLKKGEWYITVTTRPATK
jgi:hypothetical protein